MTALPKLYGGVDRPRVATRVYRPRTTFRIVRAFDDGCPTDGVVDMLRLGTVEGEVHAIIRASRICDTPTPLEYYRAWVPKETWRKIVGTPTSTPAAGGFL